MTYKEVLQFSEDVTKRYGVNYYRATTFFPRRIREAIFVYYAWLRVVDEYVDAECNQSNKEKLLHVWTQDWNKTCQHQRNIQDIHWYILQIFHRYNVPLKYADAFLHAMSQDVQKTVYANYKELEEYMYGSAVVVGLTMLYFFGLHQEKRLKNAQSFAEAMQMTNFLRDISEDFQVLGRIYMPEDEMKKFGVSVQNITEKQNSPEWKSFIKFQIQRCRDLYEQAWIGIEELPWKIKFPIRVAARKYEGILDEIEKADYDIWSKKHVLPSYKKKIITIKSIFI